MASRGRLAIAVIAVLALLTVACSDSGPAGVSPSTATPANAHFPVVLEHDTRVVASADGSDIREEPVPYQPRSSAGEGEASLGGRLRAYLGDGKLYVQQGDSEPKAIAEAVTGELAYIGWSPDGKRLAFEGSFDGSSHRMYVVSVDGLVDIARGLEGDANLEGWSVAGDRLAFSVFSPGGQTTGAGPTTQMYVANADGSNRAAIGDFVQPQGDGGWDAPSWSPDEKWIAAFSPDGGLRVLDVAGGAPKELGGDSILKWSWSPDSRFLAFNDNSVIKIADVTQAGAVRQLTKGSWPRWSPDGERIAFRRGNEVFTIRPDGNGIATLGDMGSNERGELTWSKDGAGLEFVRGTSSVEYLYAVDLGTAAATRSATSLTASGLGGVGDPIELSPDGTRVAFPVQSGKEDQYAPGWFVMDIASGDVTHVSDDPRSGDVFWSEDGVRIAFSDGVQGVFVAEGDRSPSRQVSGVAAFSVLAWSPDGRYLAFGTRTAIELIEVEGNNDRTLVSGLTPDADIVQSLQWSPDGMALLYEVSHSGVTWDTAIVDLGGGTQHELFHGEREPGRPRWSPDGKTFAFTRAGETAAELWLVDAGGGNKRLLTRFDGAYQSLSISTASSAGSVVWSPDGTKIATVLSGTDLYVVDVETGDATLTAVNASYCLMALLGWSADSQEVYVIPQCALGGI